MKVSLLTSIAFAVLVTYVSMHVVYFGFTTNYTTNTFSPSSFRTQYDHQVYKYRILAKYCLFALDRELGNSLPTNRAERRIISQDPTASERFYYAYYHLNLLFGILFALVWAVLMESSAYLRIEKGERILLLFFMPVVICLTQFVVTPYDVSSYFFEVLIFWVYLRFYTSRYALALPILCMLIILATLNRESSAISLALIVLLSYLREGFTKKWLASTALLTLSFLGTYIGLRLLIKDNYPDLSVASMLASNFSVKFNLLGMLFWILFFYMTLLLANHAENVSMIIGYHLLNIPYIWTCLVYGVFTEMRLYIPLLLGALVLSKINTSANTTRLAKLFTS